jgi:hypothetical protein
VVATGDVRGRRLVLHLKSTATKTTTRDGRRTTTRTYPRLSGRYILERPATRGRLIKAAVTFSD